MIIGCGGGELQNEVLGEIFVSHNWGFGGNLGNDVFGEI